MKEKLDEFLSTKGIKLTEEQYNYVHDVIFGKNPVANWSVAGSGKSVCLELIKEYLGDSCVVVATTGIANSILFDNAGANGTVHSCLSLPLSLHNDYHVKKVSPKTSALLGKSDLVRVILIEESGMLNPDQLALIIKRLERFNRAYGKKA